MLRLIMKTSYFLMSIIILTYYCTNNNKTYIDNQYFVRDFRGNNICEINSWIFIDDLKEAIKKYHHNNFIIDGVYQYFDFFLIKGRTSSRGPCNSLFYYPRNNTIQKATENEAYLHYKDYHITSLKYSQELLEHILLIDKYGGSIINNWGNFKAIIRSLPQRENTSYLLSKVDSLKYQIQVIRPRIIKNSDSYKHIFFVVSKPYQGTTIYRYEINVRNNHIQEKVSQKELYCFGDKRKIL